jgi:hypothetical protein
LCTVLTGPFELAEPERLPSRPVHRAALAMRVPSAPGQDHLVVLDADREEFVRVPGIPGGLMSFLGLAADGTRLLFLGGPDRTPVPPYGRVGFCLFDLATGRQTWLPAGMDFQGPARCPVTGWP